MMLLIEKLGEAVRFRSPSVSPYMSNMRERRGRRLEEKRQSAEPGDRGRVGILTGQRGHGLIEVQQGVRVGPG
jgi:hypothetical protein